MSRRPSPKVTTISTVRAIQHRPIFHTCCAVHTLTVWLGSDRLVFSCACAVIFMMLMGMRTAVGKFANVANRELAPADFDQKWDGDFLAKGSADTPAHSNHDFRFREYSPLVFRQIRERFGVMTQDYLLSLTSEYVLVEMFTNSKSGSFFFYSADYRFILKTCTKREAAFLMAALPQYHAHLMAHRYTLLCRFFGLHRVHLPGMASKKVYFVVMGNVFPCISHLLPPSPTVSHRLPPPPTVSHHVSFQVTSSRLTSPSTNATTSKVPRAGASPATLSERTQTSSSRTLTGSARGGSSTLAPTRSAGCSSK